MRVGVHCGGLSLELLRLLLLLRLLWLLRLLLLLGLLGLLGDRCHSRLRRTHIVQRKNAVFVHSSGLRHELLRLLGLQVGLELAGVAACALCCVGHRPLLERIVSSQTI